MTERVALLLCFGVIGILPTVAFAQAKNDGFFDKDFATKGFFDEGKEPDAGEEVPAETDTEPAPERTAAPVATNEDSFSNSDVPPDQIDASSLADPSQSNAVKAGNILGHVRTVIRDSKQIQENPLLMQQMREGTASVREALKVPLEHVPAVAEPTQAPQKNADPADRLIPPPSPGDKPTLSVVVKAEPRQGFLRVLERLLFAQSKMGIQIDEVYVLGKSKDLALKGLIDGKVVKHLHKHLESSGMSAEQISSLLGAVKNAVPSGALVLDRLKIQPVDHSPDISALVSNLKLQFSPTWIVRSGGRYHVFQGNYDVLELFQANGEFIGETLP